MCSLYLKNKTANFVLLSTHLWTPLAWVVTVFMMPGIDICQGLGHRLQTLCHDRAVVFENEGCSGDLVSINNVLLLVGLVAQKSQHSSTVRHWDYRHAGAVFETAAKLMRRDWLASSEGIIWYLFCYAIATKNQQGRRHNDAVEPLTASDSL